MPKKKTNKAATKRFKVMAGGRIKFRKPGAGHLLGGKSRKRKRNLRQDGVLSPVEEKRIGILLG